MKSDSLHTSPASALLVLEDGTVFRGCGLGAVGEAVGEVCFNTSMTGYQEIMTDPSYAGQIINFTFPHIGNVGTTPEDMEGPCSVARGAIFRMDSTEPSNWRAVAHLDAWLKAQNLTAITGLDTRRITRYIRENGAPKGIIVHVENDGALPDIATLQKKAADWQGLEGVDLAIEVSCKEVISWDETLWHMGAGTGTVASPLSHVVAVDYGAKRNILRSLASVGCRVTVVPCTATLEDILALQPDGVFLSNGPGDPAATGIYAVPVIRGILAHYIPLFGICLGHQLLCLALGAKTYKMRLGHRGANHPVQDLATGKVEITSQNHGFCVEMESLPDTLELTHKSLFDGSLEGVRAKEHPAFSVQYHPEASPGPHDSRYLFRRFIGMIQDKQSLPPLIA